MMNDTGPLQEKPVISDEVQKILEPAILFVTLPFNILGVVTNILNIRVFLKQGIRHDSTNISLLCLSFFDLIGCASALPLASCWFVKYTEGEALYRSCDSVADMIIHAHIPAQQTAAWITVYMSIVRTLCVLFPLKVKLLITPKITVVVIALFTVFFGSFQIQFVGTIALARVFYPEFNASLYTVNVSPSIGPVLYYKHLITNQILPVIALLVVSVNTVLMGRKLLQIKKWRHQNSSESNTAIAKNAESNSNTKSKKDSASSKPLATKEIELIKMVEAVTSIFLVCMLMGFVPSIAVMAFPGVIYDGINRNLFNTVYVSRYLFDAINASINFFFYIRVSSRYKAAFAASFPGCARDRWKDQ